MSDLLSAVDDLTLPKVVKVRQSDGDREWVTECRQVPLLRQLEAAVAGGIGSHAGASPVRERMPVNGDALDLLREIDGVVSSWYWSVPNVRVKVDLSTRLRVWYVHFANGVRGGRVSDAALGDRVRLVRGWVSQVEGLFDPVVRLELTEQVGGVSVPVACPECGERFAVDVRSGVRVTAVVVEYREVGVETLDKAVGLCRACGAVWRGGSGLRALRWLLDSGEKVSV